MSAREIGALRPNPVFCVIDGAHRELAIADAVRAGRFAIAGIELSLGCPPDWLNAGLPSDAEWEIEFQKFYYGLDLAHAFQATGDAGYVECFEALVESWLAQVPAQAFSSDVTARRIQNWIYAWLRLCEAPRFAGLRCGLAERVVASLGEQLAFVAATLSAERNHRTLELYALTIAALALPKLDPSGELLRFASAALEENLLRDVRPDGVHREHSTHYHMTALRSFLGFRENARRFELPISQRYDERLLAALDFALHIHRPDGEIPALSDADGGDYRDLLALAARSFDHSHFAWVATSGREGTPPSVTSRSFQDAGYFIQRSGWGEQRPFSQERQLVFDCGPVGDGGHGHYDALSFELYAGGPLLIDPGRFTYAEGDPNWRRWFKGTAAHNTVSVDGLDQTPYRRGKPRGGSADAKLLARFSAPGLDVLHAEVTSPAYPAVHRRRIWFVAREYWLVEDVLESPHEHEYVQRFHFAPESGALARDATCALETWRAAGMSLGSAGPSAGRLEEGFVSRRYGVKVAAPVLAFSQRGRRGAFATLLSPEREHGERRSFCRVEMGGCGPLATHGKVEVARAGGERDWIVWNDAADSVELAGFSLAARCAWVRQDARGMPIAGAALGSRSLRFDSAHGAWRACEAAS